MKICIMPGLTVTLQIILFDMPANQPIKPNNVKAKDQESTNAEIKALIEKLQLKNEALKKIYDYFGKETNKDK